MINVQDCETSILISQKAGMCSKENSLRLEFNRCLL